MRDVRPPIWPLNIWVYKLKYYTSGLIATNSSDQAATKCFYNTTRGAAARSAVAHLVSRISHLVSRIPHPPSQERR